MTHLHLIWIAAAIVLFLLAGIAGIKGYLALKKEKHENNIARLFNENQSFLLLGFVAVFVIGVGISIFYFSKKFLPYPTASPATGVVTLFNTTTIITGVAFFLTQILLFYFAFKYREKSNQQAAFVIGHLKLELLWTVVPFVTFMFLFLWGQILWAKIIEKPGDDAVEIEILAEQFNWRVRYPGTDKKLGRSDFRLINNQNDMGIDANDPNSRDDFIPLQMHVPKNRQVKLVLRSKDVIHSFFIPYFRMKMDAVPGMTTQMHFTPNVSTVEMRKRLNNPDFDYEVACAELCGRMHFGMKLILIVDEQTTFDKWYKSQNTWTQNQLSKK
jgi:cytochrome c oxidase subunit 2